MKKYFNFLLSLLFVICVTQVFVACEKEIPHECSFTIEKSDNENHWNECECGKKYEVTEHTYTIVKSDSENHWRECACGNKSEATEHVFTIEKHDNENHWKECECGNKIEIEAHTFNVSIQEENTLKQNMICGVQSTQYYYKCSCGSIGSTYFDLNDMKEYHVLDNDGKCINCDTIVTVCNHIEIKELILDKKEIDCPAIFECDKCNIKYMKSLRYSDMNMPIVNIVGDVDSATKENKVQITFNYYGEEEILDKTGTIKWQGGISIWYPKKNYTLKLDKKVELNSDWGKQKKYCLKANYSDFSQARNVVSGQIYSQIAKTRDLDDDISKLNNSGVVDGYPILVYQNGKYQGLYTLNIAKDKWMFGMKDSDEKTQAILQTKDWSAGCFLSTELTYDLQEGVSIEYYSNEESEDNSYEWAVDSFNEMIRFVKNNDGEDFRNGISNYVNVERAIDSLIYTCVIGGWDNTAKNILWVTFDGVTWLPSMYDMDSTWGLNYDNTYNSSKDTWRYMDYGNELFKKLRDNFKSEIENRYKELRQSVLSDENIDKTFTEFFDKIPDIVYEAEISKWNNENSVFMSSDYGKYQILYWAKEHLALMDS